MEMDSSFMLKQFVAIDELKPSYLSSSLDEFCKVYARAVLKPCRCCQQRNTAPMAVGGENISLI